MVATRLTTRLSTLKKRCTCAAPSRRARVSRMAGSLCFNPGSGSPAGGAIGWRGPSALGAASGAAATGDGGGGARRGHRNHAAVASAASTARTAMMRTTMNDRVPRRARSSSVDMMAGPMNATATHHLPDSRYAATRLVVAVIIMTLGAAGMYVVPVALPAVQAEFGVARADASLPYAMLMVG